MIQWPIYFICEISLYTHTNTFTQTTQGRRDRGEGEVYIFEIVSFCMLSLIIFVFCAAAVRKEIADETDRETGRSKQISSVPIHLSIHSPNGKIGIITLFLFVCFYYFNFFL